MVDYSVRGQVALLEVNNPPVNALSYAVRVGIKDGIEKASKDNKVKAIVILGKGQTFPAGADIREFGTMRKGPGLIPVGDAIEASLKPVVAAIHGTCLGGGLEVALFCHYRIALKSARVGFPEVNLGLLPGGGGTQRLPRITGLPLAFDMITTGRHVPATDALKHGILDQLISDDLVESALKFAKSVVGKSLMDRRIRYKKVPGAENATVLGEAAMAQVKKKFRGYEAPVDCVRLVRAAAELPYTEGINLENLMFDQLNRSGQARAQQYAFFAERTVGRWAMPNGSYRTAKPVPVKTTAVIGAGTMGTGIVVCLLSAGIPVILLEQNDKFLQKGLGVIKSLMEGSVRLGKIPMEVAQKAATLLKPTVNFEDLKDIDLVIEAVYEDLHLKREIFGKLDKICKPSTILCSNTSTLNVDLIASATTRQDKVAGMHFFAPAYHMKLLENIYGSKTSPDTVATIMKLGKRINKVPVLVKTCEGFLANRMNRPYNVESVYIVEEGASPYVLDQVMEDFGMPMGPYKVRDLSGIDVGWRITHEVAKSLGVTITKDTKYLGGSRYSGMGDDLYDLGRYGRKTGKGYYKYEKAGGKLATPDPEAIDIIEKYRKRRGVTERKISSQEMIERQLYSAINEGFKILEEGICSRPEDIDVSWLYGFSFPKYLGGPMFYASKVGLQKVYERICYYHENFPYSIHWLPSRLLKRLAEKNVPMSEWTNYISASKL